MLVPLGRAFGFKENGLFPENEGMKAIADASSGGDGSRRQTDSHCAAAENRGPKASTSPIGRPDRPDSSLMGRYETGH